MGLAWPSVDAYTASHKHHAPKRSDHTRVDPLSTVLWMDREFLVAPVYVHVHVQVTKHEWKTIMMIFTTRLRQIMVTYLCKFM